MLVEEAVDAIVHVVEGIVDKIEVVVNHEKQSINFP